MTLREAASALERPLVFGDIEQIRALKFLRKIDDAAERAIACDSHGAYEGHPFDDECDCIKHPMWAFEDDELAALRTIIEYGSVTEYLHWHSDLSVELRGAVE